MSDVNKMTIIGRLTEDPKIHYTKSGIAVTTIQVATNPQKRDVENAKAEFHSVVCWASTAENVCKYLKKASEVYVEGRIKTAQWEDAKGVRQYKKEVHAYTVNFLGSKAQVTELAKPAKKLTKA